MPRANSRYDPSVLLRAYRMDTLVARAFIDARNTRKKPGYRGNGAKARREREREIGGKSFDSSIGQGNIRRDRRIHWYTPSS